MHSSESVFPAEGVPLADGFSVVSEDVSERSVWAQPKKENVSAKEQSTAKIRFFIFKSLAVIWNQTVAVSKGAWEGISVLGIFFWMI